MWVVFALLTAFFYTIAHFVTKYSVEKNVKDVNGITLAHAMAAQIILIAAWLITGCKTMDSKSTLGAMGSGLLIGLAAQFYFRVFKLEDASTVTLLSKISLPINLLVGYLIFSDTLTNKQLLGLPFIICGALLAAKEPGKFRIKNPISLLIVAVCCSIWAFSSVLIRKNVGDYSVFTFGFFQNLGYIAFGVVTLAFSKKIQRATIKNFKPFRIRLPLVILLSELFFVFAVTSEIRALSMSKQGLVSAVTSSEASMAALLGLVLTLLLPKLIKEDIRREVLVPKLAGALLLIPGVILLI